MREVSKTLRKWDSQLIKWDNRKTKEKLKIQLKQWSLIKTNKRMFEKMLKRIKYKIKCN